MNEQDWSSELRWLNDFEMSESDQLANDKSKEKDAGEGDKQREKRGDDGQAVITTQSNSEYVDEGDGVVTSEEAEANSIRGKSEGRQSSGKRKREDPSQLVRTQAEDREVQIQSKRLRGKSLLDATVLKSIKKKNVG